MQDVTRRTVLAGVAATAGIASLPADAAIARLRGALTPIKGSAVAMAEDGTLTFSGMARPAFAQEFASRARWSLYRFARAAGHAELMAENERLAREAGAVLAALLREQGYGEAEIAEELRSHEAEDPNDYWRRWIED